jgi:hypothetical protein
MRKILPSLIFILSLFLLSSCDPGYGVFLVNKTSNEIRVKVLFKNRHRELNYINDSVCLTDTVFSDSLKDWYCIKAIKDSSDGSYYFKVDKYKMANFEGGQGMPEKNQMIIINENDTLTFTSKANLIRSGNFMSKRFIFTYK